MWSKVSCPERLSITGPKALDGEQAAYRDVVPFARSVVEEFPDRVLWGTDWPHPNLKTTCPTTACWWISSPHRPHRQQLQRKLLVDNPMRLYWPEEVPPVKPRLTGATWPSKNPIQDVPGMTIFDADQSRKGYWLNQFCMSLMQAEQPQPLQGRRDAYLAEWSMTDEQRAGRAGAGPELDDAHRRQHRLPGQDWAPPIGLSFQQMAGTMTGMTESSTAT